ncbi:MAG: hypothetical protein ACLS43_02715 [Evtepia gabavorous]
MMLAKIALSAATFAIDRPYSYRVPAQLENLLEPGMRVLVPFGKGNRSSEGLVLSLEQAEETHRLKEIQTLLDRRPVLTPEGIQLALWMRERFFCTVYAAALTMLPTGLWYVLKEGYALAPGWTRRLGGQGGPSRTTGDDPPPRSRRLTWPRSEPFPTGKTPEGCCGSWRRRAWWSGKPRPGGRSRIRRSRLPPWLWTRRRRWPGWSPGGRRRPWGMRSHPCCATWAAPA